MSPKIRRTTCVVSISNAGKVSFILYPCLSLRHVLSDGRRKVASDRLYVYTLSHSPNRAAISAVGLSTPPHTKGVVDQFLELPFFPRYNTLLQRPEGVKGLWGIGGSLHMVPKHTSRKKKTENRPVLTASVINLSLFNLPDCAPAAVQAKTYIEIIDDVSSLIHGENQVSAG